MTQQRCGCSSDTPIQPVQWQGGGNNPQSWMFPSQPWWSGGHHHPYPWWGTPFPWWGQHHFWPHNPWWPWGQPNIGNQQWGGHPSGPGWQREE